ncbi:hypothetical protein C7Y71_002145 [Pseudoprevotella muciniphila]|uniref:Caspase family p20 domain-containing protein n=1 Tax=Pseudoprevotella muciniphila TaxID=2133944 RepID=A0A5P8E4N0_9BACT|nr:leucine-rich repeat protein [Pseudoprevotella muciniphila]QFQ11921.1 hypothetical protein C7Y71_002145 [Pseudoprevotella muciniphila]
MKRVFLISNYILFGLIAIYSQRVEILKLSTDNIAIGNAPNVKTYKVHGVFNANETIHWNAEKQSMKIKILDGKNKRHITDITKKDFEKLSINTVAKYMSRPNEKSRKNTSIVHGSWKDIEEVSENSDSVFPEKRFALVIGNSNYEHLKRLDNPKNDVDSVTDKLCSLDFDVLPAYDADYKQFNNLINILSEKKDYDVVLVYYSGHGIRHNNKQYLIPIDAEIKDPSDLENNCFTLYQLYTNLGILKEAKARIVFIDACRTETPWQKEGDSEEEAEQDNPIAVIYSTSKNKKAFDGKSGGNSPFAKAFIQEIGNPSESLAKTIGNINEILQQNTNGIQSVSDHGSAIITKFTFVAVEKGGISLITNMDVIRNVAEGRINAEQLGFDAQKFLGYSNVDISTSVTSILDYGFKDCDELYSISIPKTVTKIGKNVFEGCEGLSEIIISPDNPKYDSRDSCNAVIENETNTIIAGCKETIIPNSVTSIGKSAFKGCSGLTSITIPNSVTSIGNHAFNDCSNLTSVTIPNSVTSIGDEAFYNCSGLTSVAIPNSVTSIGSNAFYNCTGLTSVTIPNSVTIIENGVFGGCSSLTSVTIPNSVTSIGEWAFMSCTGLTSVNIPNSVTSIGEWAFNDCSNLTSVTIPNSVTSIGDKAFKGCSGLTSVTIPNSVTSIGEWAFNGCTGLTSVTIPNSVTSIGEWAFEGCTGLTSVTIPNSVTSIGDNAFEDCSNLTSVTIPKSVKEIGSGAFNNTPWFNKQEDGLVYVGNVAYKYKGEMLEGATINIKEGTTSIADYAFKGCSGLTSITIPNSVTSIGNHAFNDCSNLTSVTIPNSVTSIGEWAFEGCSGLTSVTIPNSVTSIGDGAFWGCSGLNSIIIPNSVTSIGKSAFSGCTDLVYVTIPASVKQIGSGALKGTSWYDMQPDGLIYVGNVAYKYKGEMPEGTTINLKEGTASIADEAFYGCSGLTSVTIPNSVTSIGEWAFEGCSGLTSVTIPNSVTSIGEWAFKGCSGLTSITIPNSVSIIENGVFGGCSGLTSVTIPNSVTSIGYCAFEDCSNLTSVTIPNSVTTIGQEAFSGCNKLKSISLPNSVEYIEFAALGYNLENMYIKRETPCNIVWMLPDLSIWRVSSCTLHVPKGCKEAYENEEPWCDFKEIVDDL